MAQACHAEPRPRAGDREFSQCLPTVVGGGKKKPSWCTFIGGDIHDQVYALRWGKDNRGRHQLGCRKRHPVERDCPSFQPLKSKRKDLGI